MANLQKRYGNCWLMHHGVYQFAIAYEENKFLYQETYDNLRIMSVAIFVADFNFIHLRI